ncbi:MAG: ferrochelatase [Phycisphaerae bacterium]
MSFSRTNPGHPGRNPSGDASPARRERGVLLINLGSPDEPTVPAVRRYLSQFLSDPAVIQLPRGLGWFNRVLGRLIGLLRAPTSAEMYRSIWSEHGSPLISISLAQAEALREALPRGWRVFTAMRYGRPSIADTLREIEASGVEELVVVPMYPQFSGPTTGTAMREVYDYLSGDDHPLPVATRLSWYNDCGYIAAQRDLIAQYAREHGLSPDNCYLLFSTHGLPVSYVERGDPYPEHVAQTVSLVGQQLGWPEHRMSLAFQSRFGPTQWMQPYTDVVLEQLVADGEKRFLICPISFTTDCLETLEEIDIRYRKTVEDAGAELYLCPAPNTFAPFITALKHLVLRGCRPITGPQRSLAAITGAKPAHSTQRAASPSLVMVGMSLKGRLADGLGPDLRHTDESGLRRIKRSSCEVPALLRDMQETLGVREAFLWNTCHRVEYYGYLDDAGDARRQRDTVSRISQQLFGAGAAEVNVLVGRDARWHLMRTAVGLNSSLPGERDVLDQFKAAHRLAARAGAAGPLCASLLKEVVDAEQQLRTTTDWGRFDPDYCHIAMKRIAEEECIDFAECRIVVVGGSTTSASVCSTLIKRFHVSGRQLTLLHRGHKHGGHLKLLRQAIGNGRRLRVQSYSEDRVLRACCEAGLVVFGTDRAEPILNADHLHRYRADRSKPLVVVDFNSFGSTEGVAASGRVRLCTHEDINANVRAHADALCRGEAFQNAARHAEAWVACQITGGAKHLLCAAGGGRERERPGAATAAGLGSRGMVAARSNES